jgi:hypothetical protein
MPMSVLIRLFATSCAWVVGALAAVVLFVWWMPANLANSQLLAGLAPTIRQIGALVSVACIFLAACSYLIAVWRWHRWRIGRGRSCRRCGGLVLERSGRHSTYEQCLHCGLTH